jgi:hypothetical protein
MDSYRCINSWLFFLVLSLLLVFPKKLAVGQGLSDFENALIPLSSNPSFYIVSKNDWILLKNNFEIEYSQSIKINDSLSRTVILQRDSIQILKTSKADLEKSTKPAAVFGILFWAISALLIIVFLSLIILTYINHLKIKDNILHLEFLEKKHSASKSYWIEQEKILKRKLIDLQMLVNKNDKMNSEA